MLFAWGGWGLVPRSEGAPVDHSEEWSTSYLEKGRNQANAPKSHELVVHSGEWSTSFLEKGRNRVKAPKKREPVVHFGE